ncbi:MAG: DNA/RNA non-specific endonuclease [Bacteroidales bacterium]
MSKKGSIKRNLLKNTKRRRNRQSLLKVISIFILALLLVAYIGYVRGNKPTEPFITNSISCDLMTIETPDSTSYRYDYDGFSVYFNPTWRVPSAVIYELTREELKGTESRKKKYFKPDLTVEYSAHTKDYSKSGYDRGHMAPANDMNWDKSVMEQSFLMTNIAPQNGNLNSGQWRGLETKIRQWGERDSALVVITGTIFNGSRVQTIGDNQVGVPPQLYKIVFAPYVKTPRMIAYLYDNCKPMHQVSDYVVTVDSIEKLTGNDFFVNLPDNLERELENKSNLELWNIDE